MYSNPPKTAHTVLTNVNVDTCKFKLLQTYGFAIPLPIQVLCNFLPPFYMHDMGYISFVRH